MDSWRSLGLPLPSIPGYSYYIEPGLIKTPFKTAHPRQSNMDWQKARIFTLEFVLTAEELKIAEGFLQRIGYSYFAMDLLSGQGDDVYITPHCVHIIKGPTISRVSNDKWKMECVAEQFQERSIIISSALYPAIAIDSLQSSLEPAHNVIIHKVINRVGASTENILTACDGVGLGINIQTLFLHDVGNTGLDGSDLFDPDNLEGSVSGVGSGTNFTRHMNYRQLTEEVTAAVEKVGDGSNIRTFFLAFVDTADALRVFVSDVGVGLCVQTLFPHPVSIADDRIAVSLNGLGSGKFFDLCRVSPPADAVLSLIGGIGPGVHHQVNWQYTVVEGLRLGMPTIGPGVLKGPARGSIRVTVLRSDNHEPVSGANVEVD